MDSRLSLKEVVLSMLLLPFPSSHKATHTIFWEAVSDQSGGAVAGATVGGVLSNQTNDDLPLEWP
jgi:hypothetical protein